VFLRNSRRDMLFAALSLIVGLLPSVTVSL